MSDLLINLSSEYLTDYHRWLGQQCDLSSIKQLDLIQQDIILNQEVSWACFFAAETSHNSHLMQQIILNSNSPKYITLFAQCVPNADTQALERALFASQHPQTIRYLVRFAASVPTANLRKIETRLFNEVSVDTRLIPLAVAFLKAIPSAKIERFKPLILQAGAPQHLYWLAQQGVAGRELRLSPAQIRQIEDRLLEAKSFRFIRLFAANIPGAGIAKLEEFVLASGNIKEIRLFAKAVSNAKSRGLSILF
jgi:hypothetical protein